MLRSQEGMSANGRLHPTQLVNPTNSRSDDGGRAYASRSPTVDRHVWPSVVETVAVRHTAFRLRGW